MVLFLFLVLLVFGGLCLAVAAIGANQPSGDASSDDAGWGSRSAKKDAALSNQSDDDWSYDYDYDYDYDE